MKRIKYLIVSLIGLFVLMPTVMASSASISVKTSGTAVVGNTITATVTVSSSSKIGSWNILVSYDSSKLQLIEGDLHQVDAPDSPVTSKTFNYKFKAKASGNASINIGSYQVVDDATFDLMSVSVKNASVKVMTQAELEATYSDDASLKSISVTSEDGTSYDLSPKFSKKTLEYMVEVPNEITKVNVKGSVSDGNASLSGNGELELNEGNNTIELRVTAQKGNEQTYTVTVNRKELDPINVTIDSKDYTIVRRPDLLPAYTGMSEVKIDYNGDEIPALKSDITGLTVIALRTESGDVVGYIYEDNKLTKPYIELSSNLTGIIPLDVENNDDYKNYKIKDIEINGINIKALVLNDDDEFAIIYALDAATNEKDYYSYDLKNNTVQRVNNELVDYMTKQLNLYRYIILGFIGIVILLLLVIAFKKPKKKKLTKTEFEQIEKQVLKELTESEESENETEEVNEDDLKELLDNASESEEVKSVDEIEVTEIKMDEEVELSKKEKRKKKKAEKKKEKDKLDNFLE